MSKDFNNISYPHYELDEDVSDSEDHYEGPDETMKSNVVKAQHPIFSKTGIVDTINASRNYGNTTEKELSGEVKEKVFSDVAKAAKKTKCPVDFLLFMCDWEKDLTSRSDASDAESIAKKVLSYVPQLRQAFGRDPLHAEVFSAYCVNSAQKVKEIYEKNVKAPEELAAPPGSKKDDILVKKLRNGNPVPRTNREHYDFYYRRFPTGKILFKTSLGKDKYST